MTALIIDGKARAARLRTDLTQAVAGLGHHVRPGLAVVLVGDDPASAVYVRNKTKAAAEIGLMGREIILPATTSQAALDAVIDQLNADPEVHGILVQLPLPPGLDTQAVIARIAVDKDVDGLHPENAGRLASGLDSLVSCTPQGCLMLIEEAASALSMNLAGAEALMIGRSNLMGKPMAQLLLKRDLTVTIAHSKTRDLAQAARRADVLVAAIGRPEMVKGTWIKPGAIVIDVGINRIDLGQGKSKIVGDVAYGEAFEVAGAITPVPGGVGPMTIACLMRNTIIAACRQAGVAHKTI